MDDEIPPQLFQAVATVLAFVHRIGAARLTGRAVSLPVDASSGVAGLLKPGDLVDVMATVEEAGQPRTFALMQAAPVLAVGRSFSASGGAQETGGIAGAGAADTVTLAGSPYEAEQLSHLEQVGRLKLVLRSAGDRERVALPAISGVRMSRPSADGDGEVRKR